MMPRNSPRSLRADPEEINRIRKTVRDMVEKDGNSLATAARRIGISPTTASKYYQDAKKYLNITAPPTSIEMRAQKRREVASR